MHRKFSPPPTNGCTPCAAVPKRACDVKSRWWCYTLNNPLPQEISDFRPGDFGVHQLEAGDNGTPHLQGVCYFSQLKTLAALKKLHFRVHWEVMSGTADQAIDYCNKPIANHPNPKIRDAAPPLSPPVTWGEKPRQGKRSDLHDAADIIRETAGPISKKMRAVAESNPAAYIKYHRGFAALALAYEETAPKGKPSNWRPWQQWMLDILQRPADDRHIFWVVDRHGGQGKSTLVQYLITNFPEDYAVLQGKVADMAFAYQGEGVVFFDVPRTQLDHMDHLYNFAEQLKNGSIFSTKYESRRKVFPSPHVVFFANALPAADKWSDDRLILVDLEPFTPHTIPVPLFHPPALPHTDIDTDGSDSDDESTYGAPTQEFHYGG